MSYIAPLPRPRDDGALKVSWCVNNRSLKNQSALCCQRSVNLVSLLITEMADEDADATPIFSIWFSLRYLMLVSNRSLSVGSKSSLPKYSSSLKGRLLGPNCAATLGGTNVSGSTPFKEVAPGVTVIG